MAQVAARGFVNYFGLQRFGVTAIGTFRVGIALLRHDWQGAIDLILSPGGVDSPAAAEAKRRYLTTRVCYVCIVCVCCVMLR